MIVKAIHWFEHFQDAYSKKFAYHIYLFCILGFLFLSYRLYSYGGFPLNTGLSNKRITLSIIFYFFSTIFQFCVWFELIGSYKPVTKHLPLITIHYLSAIAKYIPGAGWNYFGRNVLLDQWFDVPSKVTVRVFSLEICAVIASLLICSTNILILNLSVPIAILTFLAVLVFTYVPFYLFFRTINSELIFNNFTLVSLKVFLWSLLSFVFFVISFVVLIPGSEGTKGFLYIAGVYSFSTLIGFISPFPAGIGVREAMPIVFLAKNYGEHVVLAAAIAMRMIIIFCDLAVFFLALLINKYLLRDKVQVKG